MSIQTCAKNVIIIISRKYNFETSFAVNSDNLMIFFSDDAASLSSPFFSSTIGSLILTSSMIGLRLRIIFFELIVALSSDSFRFSPISCDSDLVTNSSSSTSFNQEKTHTKNDTNVLHQKINISLNYKQTSSTASSSKISSFASSKDRETSEKNWHWIICSERTNKNILFIV